MYTILALAVLALAVVPVGAAVFVLGFIYGDSPCVMCWEQRIGMALVALIGLFVLRFGPRPRYVGLSILVGAWGVFMGARHVGMHAARDIGQGFSAEILGAHTYTWSIFIFWVAIVTMGALLLMVREGERAAAPRVLRPIDRLAMVVFLVVIAGNIIQAFASTGPPPYMGQGDPVRFSFNPKHWVWSLEEWSPAPMSWRGRWAAEKPSVAGLNTDPNEGPLVDLPVLATAEQGRLPAVKGTVTDLAYDAASDRFALTTQRGVYVLDGALQRVARYTVVDPGYSVDLGDFAGVAFLGGDTLMALGENKSYVVLRIDDKAEAAKNFRYFLESFDRFSEQSRSRLTTVRARMMYAMSLAFEPPADSPAGAGHAGGGSLYTITVPNAKSKRMVVSRFDRKDFTLSEEFVPLPAGTEAKPLVFKPNRSLDDLYVTGAAIEGGRMYALSAAYGTLLTIDLATHRVTAAHAIPGLSRPSGLAIKGDTLVIVSAEGRIQRVPKPQ